MKISVTEEMFIQGFKETRPNKFSASALKVLYEYLERLDEESGVDSEFEPIDLAGWYHEEPCEKFIVDRNIELYTEYIDDDDEEAKKEAIQEAIKAYIDAKGYSLVGFTDEGTLVHPVEL